MLFERSLSFFVTSSRLLSDSTSWLRPYSDLTVVKKRVKHFSVTQFIKPWSHTMKSLKALQSLQEKRHYRYCNNVIEALRSVYTECDRERGLAALV